MLLKLSKGCGELDGDPFVEEDVVLDSKIIDFVEVRAGRSGEPEEASVTLFTTLKFRGADARRLAAFASLESEEEDEEVLATSEGARRTKPRRRRRGARGGSTVARQLAQIARMIEALPLVGAGRERARRSKRKKGRVDRGSRCEQGREGCAGPC